MQRHPKLDETGEVELINTYVPLICPYCKQKCFQKYGHTRIGVATDKKNTVIIAEGFGKPSQKMRYDAFINHIQPGSVLIHDKESTHKKLIKELGLVNEEYAAKDLKGLEDFENPHYFVIVTEHQ